MPFIIDVKKIRYEPSAYANQGGTQCAALVQLGPPAKGSKNPPGTSKWRRGLRVKTAGPGVIKEGTVIATFTPAGRYPNKAEGARHTGVYVSHDSKGIRIIDQWATKTTPKERNLPYAGDESARNVNKGDHYYVVETEDTVAETTPEEKATAVD